ncbi:MAG: serine hydrolase domain-containing protein [Lysobacteraceae bacterium]
MALSGTVSRRTTRTLLRHVVFFLLAFAPGVCLPSPPTPTPTPTITPPLRDLTGQPVDPAALDAWLHDAMATHRISGLSITIVHHDQVVYRRAMGTADADSGRAVTEDTLFEAASLSKPLFAYFAMTFVEEGRLNLDRPLSDYLIHPDLPNDAAFRRVTARQILDHTSGLPNWRSGPTPRSDWRQSMAEDALVPLAAPGERFIYSGEGYQYLALVLQHLSDTDAAGLEHLFQHRVAGPLGLQHTRFVSDARTTVPKALPHRDGKRIEGDGAIDGQFGAAYGVTTEAGDYGRWIATLLSRCGLKPDICETYFEPQHVPIPDDYPERAFGLVDWALGFSVYRLPMGRLYVHGGTNPGYTSVVALHRDSGWGLVVFSNADESTAFLMALMAHLQRLD